MNAQQILDNMVEEAETPLFLCRHYELECESEEKAGELAYEINDGWGTLVNAETKGKTLCFANCNLGILCSVAGGLEKTPKDYAKMLNDDWFMGKAVFLSFIESTNKYPTEWAEHIAKRYEAMK